MLSYPIYYFAVFLIFGISVLKAVMYLSGNLKYFFLIYMVVIVFEISLEYL